MAKGANLMYTTSKTLAKILDTLDGLTVNRYDKNTFDKPSLIFTNTKRKISLQSTSLIVQNRLFYYNIDFNFV